MSDPVGNGTFSAGMELRGRADGTWTTFGSMSASIQDGKLLILRAGVLREFRSVSEYLDTVALRGGKISSDVTQALREMERLSRHGVSDEIQTAKEKGGTPHWLT